MANPLTAPLPLLRSVSRSFYLSIRLLPAGLRAPIALAYLLARAADTVADSGTADAARRLAVLASLGAAFESLGVEKALRDELLALADLQPDPAEAQLLRQADAAVASLSLLAESDRAHVQGVLWHIVRGQRLDLERFPGTLHDAATLEEYTYLVAGCVGEFWTDICAAHLEDFARLPHGRMRELGRSFGSGLQLVNIIRDAGADLAAGRCYFPADEIAAVGLESVWTGWQAIARERVADGMAYAQAVNSRRVRAAVALPAILGIRTLALVRETGPAALTQRVKVPRHEVRAILLRMAVSLAGREAVCAEWDNRAR
ncbi:MAG: squalene/phytoene synthase family protein [Burkholderiales bacterium]|nr:squalene/phytoene synthase family protein [Burkholderiales bacterium]